MASKSILVVIVEPIGSLGLLSDHEHIFGQANFTLEMFSPHC